MDPRATLADMLDYVEMHEYADAAECAVNLKRWICSGGFVPAGYTRNELRAKCNRVIDLAA